MGIRVSPKTGIVKRSIPLKWRKGKTERVVAAFVFAPFAGKAFTDLIGCRRRNRITSEVWHPNLRSTNHY